MIKRFVNFGSFWLVLCLPCFAQQSHGPPVNLNPAIDCSPLSACYEYELNPTTGNPIPRSCASATGQATAPNDTFCATGNCDGDGIGCATPTSGDDFNQDAWTMGANQLKCSFEGHLVTIVTRWSCHASKRCECVVVGTNATCGSSPGNNHPLSEIIVWQVEENTVCAEAPPPLDP